LVCDWGGTFFGGVGWWAKLLELKTGVFCGRDEGFFEFQICLKFRRHHLIAVVFKGAAEEKR
jgi:hypothetical protein